MGYSLSWIAVYGRDKASVLETLGLEEVQHDPRSRRSLMSIAELPTGWVLLLCDRSDEGVKPPWHKTLSRGGRTVGVSVEEHVMHSKAVGYADGVMSWQVEHDCEKGENHLEAQGKPPAEFAEIKSRLMAKQEAHGESPDYLFDGPADLGHTITGYRHDISEYPWGTGLESAPVARARTTRKSGGLFARLFGRG